MAGGGFCRNASGHPSRPQGSVSCRTPDGIDVDPATCPDVVTKTRP
jgi:hypothetical protein